MPLVGEHQAEDRQLIADMVLVKMNQLAEKPPSNSPQRPTTIQPSQVCYSEVKRAYTNAHTHILAWTIIFDVFSCRTAEPKTW